jgi:hypothetical protein
VDPHEAYEILARGAELAHRTLGPREASMMWGPAANALLAAGRYEEALVAADRAWELGGSDTDDRRTWALRGFRLQALAMLDRCDAIPRTPIPPGAEDSNGYVYGHVLVALRDGDRPRATALLEAFRDRRIAAGSEEADAVRELIDIVGGRRTGGSWWLARVLAQWVSG